MSEAAIRETRDALEKFSTYEDYLDSLVTDDDRFYLESDELARQLVSISTRKGDVLTKTEFQNRKDAVGQQKSLKSQSAPKTLASSGYDLSHSTFLRHLAAREDLVRSGKMSTIIFIRDRNAEGHEISGYIDYGHRLRTDNFENYFAGTGRFLPIQSDLSFYNWRTQKSYANDSPNFQVIPDKNLGIVFKNKSDRRIINVDPMAELEESISRHEIKNSGYEQAIIFDHMSRKRC